MIFIWPDKPEKRNRAFDAPFALTSCPGRKSAAALQIRWFPSERGYDWGQGEHANIQTLTTEKIGIQKNFQFHHISANDFNILLYPGRFSLPFVSQTQ